ncbi:hypothetical protein [Limnohabitans sp. Bal53]|uniref:hypothetical protein n=1 Tax=Limnohabitans sp. Bal53 TaxID=1977910 RepID=UPI000D333028|nr:hypothetical protein [Limnohabitans sp. Bal53]PUE41372.1 hypothetical protein B9Z50_06585 [Limnohabitans sp. Bal53]
MCTYRVGVGLKKAVIVHRDEPNLMSDPVAGVKVCALAADQLDITAKDWGPDACIKAGQPST